MDLLYGFLLGIVASVIAGVILAPIRQGMSEVWHVIRSAIDPDGVNLSGRWKAAFIEPTENNGEKEETEEVITLRQIGRRVSGTSTIGQPMPRKFQYHGTLCHRILSATYRRIDAEKGSVSGSGFLYAKLSDDRMEINGVCVWLDKHTRRIEMSRYKLSRDR